MIKEDNPLSGGSLIGQGDLFQQVDGGSIPTPPLQTSPKDLVLFRMNMGDADRFSIEHHYLHRTAANSKLAFGVRLRGDNTLRGVIIWGSPVAMMNQDTNLELRRMFLEDSLPKNSESRALSVCIRLIRRIMPNVKYLISYSDLAQGHYGIIYKASGWRRAGLIKGDPKGGWGTTHPRHNRVEYSDKIKWMYPMY